MRELLVRAFQSPLTAQQLQLLVRRLDSDAAFARHTCETGEWLPTRLAELIECNPMFAVECVSRVLHGRYGGGARVSEYLEALIAAPLSLHSLDVVNRLISLSQQTSTSVSDSASGSSSAGGASPLTVDFLSRFIAHCLRACDAKAADKYLQARLVRLVCVFVQSLLRNEQHTELQVRLRAFCV